MAKRKGSRQAMVDKTLHRDQRLSNRNSTKNRIELSFPQDYTVPAPPVTFIVLLLDDTNIACCRNRVRHEFYWINTNMINEKQASYKSKDEPNNVLTRTLLRTSQYENENVMTYNRAKWSHEPQFKKTRGEIMCFGWAGRFR